MQWKIGSKSGVQKQKQILHKTTLLKKAFDDIIKNITHDKQSGVRAIQDKQGNVLLRNIRLFEDGQSTGNELKTARQPET